MQRGMGLASCSAPGAALAARTGDRAPGMRVSLCQQLDLGLYSTVGRLAWARLLFRLWQRRGPLRGVLKCCVPLLQASAGTLQRSGPDQRRALRPGRRPWPPSAHPGDPRPACSGACEPACLRAHQRTCSQATRGRGLAPGSPKWHERDVNSLATLWRTRRPADSRQATAPRRPRGCCQRARAWPAAVPHARPQCRARPPEILQGGAVQPAVLIVWRGRAGRASAATTPT